MGAASCVSCYNGWTINHARTECIRTRAHARAHEQANAKAPSNGATHASHCTAAANKCTCDNGVPQTGAGCLVVGAAECSSCNAGWTINRDRTECIRTSHARVNTELSSIFSCWHCDSAVNMCTCLNGVGQAGPGCPVNGAAKCLACNSGWTINDDKTECIQIKRARAILHEQANNPLRPFDDCIL